MTDHVPGCRRVPARPPIGPKPDYDCPACVADVKRQLAAGTPIRLPERLR